MSKPFFKIKPYDDTWLIVDPFGDLLYGDHLPKTKDDAIQACRIANAAYDRAKEELIKHINKL